MRRVSNGTVSIDGVAVGSLISLCACMGPMYGEPHCPCTMDQLGLPLNVATRAFASLQANMQLTALFGPGGVFETSRQTANARILVSRNKREGRYAGWSRYFYIDPVTYAVSVAGSRHQRENIYGGLDALRARRQP